MTRKSFFSVDFVDFQKAIIVFAALLFLWDSSKATPVTGVLTCLNNEDCLGAKRHCLRNSSMRIGKCVCDEGFKQAAADQVKCLSIRDGECYTNADCPSGSSCFRHFPDSLDHVISAGSFDQFPFQKQSWMHRCVFPFRKELDHKTGIGNEFFDHYYSVGRRHRLNSDFHPQYIKFVEDAMLVLFLLCVLVTLLVVHRATCYRQFRNSRRNGPLRYIIPHRDDQPPPYGNFVPAATAEDNGEGVDGEAGQSTGVHQGRGKGTANCSSDRGETPPPTYDEALIISQSSNIPVPLFIALPDPEAPESPNVNLASDPLNVSIPGPDSQNLAIYSSYQNTANQSDDVLCQAELSSTSETKEGSDFKEVE